MRAGGIVADSGGDSDAEAITDPAEDAVAD
jgi:hypothetical protein